MQDTPESQHLAWLFEKNTIRKSSNSKPTTRKVSLPEPVNGPAQNFPTPNKHHRPILLPFQEATPKIENKPEKPASAHDVARLKHLYALDTPPNAMSTTRDLPSPEQLKHNPLPPKLTPSKTPTPKVTAMADPSSTLQEQQQRQLKIKLLIMECLLKWEQTLEKRLKGLTEVLGKGLKLWRLRLWVPQSTLQLEEMRLQYLPQPRNLPESENDYALVMKTARSKSVQDRNHHRLLIPCVHENKALALLDFVHSPAHQLSDEEKQLIEAIALQLGNYLHQIASQNQELTQAKERFLAQSQEIAKAKSEISDTVKSKRSQDDPLTGLLNHSAWQTQLQILLENKQFPVALLILNLDCFRQLNDVHGFSAGDQVLSNIAQLVKKHSPQNAILGRFDGESFVLALPHASGQRAEKLAEELRQRIAQSPIMGRHDNQVKITVSIGVSMINAPQKEARNQLLYRGQEALQRAKSMGRDQVHFWTANTPIQTEQNKDLKPTTPSKPAVASHTPVTKPTPLSPAPKRPGSQALKGPHLPSQGSVKPTPAIPATPVRAEARKNSELLQELETEVLEEWLDQTADYDVPEVIAAVKALQARFPRLMQTLYHLLDQKSSIDELKKMPISYYLPPVVLNGIRQQDPKYQLISFEVALMLFQESLQIMVERKLSKQSHLLGPAIEGFYDALNGKMTELKNELQRR